MPKPSVFLSYSHRDEDWKDRLRTHLKVLEHVGTFVVWDDRRIDAGDTWYDEIREAMDGAAAAVCLISAPYLASDFVVKEEIPYLLERRRGAGMLLLPVLLDECPWKKVPWLRDIQLLPRDGKTVRSLRAAKAKKTLSEVAELLADRLAEAAPESATRGPKADYGLGAPREGGSDPGPLEGIKGDRSVALPPSRRLEETPARPAHRKAPPFQQPEAVDLARLPITGAELFGRQAELDWLDAAWADGARRVVALVAWGGMGKSTLVNKWLEQMEPHGYRGARRVFGWSFYSQGTSEQATSADLFIATALAFFGDPDPTAGSPWLKGERLAELVRKERNLLILDGLEPLQSPSEGGRIKDPALGTLLMRLARSGGDTPALCVVTTREPVGDLADFVETAESRDLERISPEAGRALLRVGGARGTDAELEDATGAFGRHAMAVILLAAYLRGIENHPIAAASEIPDLDIPEAKGRHPRRVMEAFARRYGAGGEVELLSVLGLFNGPAAGDAVAAVRAAPPIPGLTDHLVSLDEAGWLHLLHRLRQDRLLSAENSRDPNILDCHPLVREHFGEGLEHECPAAWREGHRRLYVHYKGATSDLPDTLEEMAPLYAAVAHGCRAGRYQEALDEVYWARIHRQDKRFAILNLGAIRPDLPSLAGFFEHPWVGLVGEFSPDDQAFLFNRAGNDLRALGRLAEADEPMRLALKLYSECELTQYAAISASGLSQIRLALGNVPAALDIAQQGVDLADRCGDSSQRVINRCSLAHSLHQAGRATEAEGAFREAESIECERPEEHPLLHSADASKYCELLLARGSWREVERRAQQSLCTAEGEGHLLEIALAHLSLGCALVAERRDLDLAAEHLNRAVEGLRRADQIDVLPRGLIARAGRCTLVCDFPGARSDLDEALSIATRSSMRLFQADAHLGFARLHLAEGNRLPARESLERGRKLVEETGYHRRDKEVQDLDWEIAS